MLWGKIKSHSQFLCADTEMITEESEEHGKGKSDWNIDITPKSSL